MATAVTANPHPSNSSSSPSSSSFRHPPPSPSHVRSPPDNHPNSSSVSAPVSASPGAGPVGPGAGRPADPAPATTSAAALSVSATGGFRPGRSPLATTTPLTTGTILRPSPIISSGSSPAGAGAGAASGGLLAGGVSSSPATTTTTSVTTTPPPNPAPCDACYQRRSRCAMNESVNKCYSCEFHRQDCTFAVSSQLGKRKLEGVGPESVKRPAKDVPSPPTSVSVPPSSAGSRRVEATEPLRLPMTSQHIGLTTELEPLVLDYLTLDQNNESLVASSRVRKFTDEGTFMRMIDGPPPSRSLSLTMEGVDNLVTPFGPALVDKYFEHVHPVFPVLVEDSFRQGYNAKRGFSPSLLAAMYLVALKFLDTGSGIQTLRTPDAMRLESATCKILNEALARPSLSALQAGLLVSQKSTLFTPALMAQLATAAFDLGLHQDCSDWKLPDWEKGLRKRLAWALYVQDKWCALAHGRPSHIFAPNWTVRGLTTHDFRDPHSQPAARKATQEEDMLPDADDTANNNVKKNKNNNTTTGGTLSMIFCELVDLTRILSDVLDTFYTLQAAADFAAAGEHSTRMILERAKPIQIRLKDWFARLPTEVKIDSNNSNNTSSSGGLHLAYFATEITLHRCIIRSLGPHTADAYLTHICRSAAKTRLISAMDLVNRLRPTHLRSFWSSAARTNFALIGAFGILLRITAETREEEEFYRTRLGEYRWTLSVNCRDAEFLVFAIDSLDVASGLLRNAPQKPDIDEIMLRSSESETPPPIPPSHPHPPSIINTQPRPSGVRFRDEEGGEGGEEDLEGEVADASSAAVTPTATAAVTAVGSRDQVRSRSRRATGSSTSGVSGLASPATSTISSTISPTGGRPQNVPPPSASTSQGRSEQ